MMKPMKDVIEVTNTTTEDVAPSRPLAFHHGWVLLLSRGTTSVVQDLRLCINVEELA